MYQLTRPTQLHRMQIIAVPSEIIDVRLTMILAGETQNIQTQSTHYTSQLVNQSTGWRNGELQTPCC